MIKAQPALTDEQLYFLRRVRDGGNILAWKHRNEEEKERLLWAAVALIDELALSLAGLRGAIAGEKLRKQVQEEGETDGQP